MSFRKKLTVTPAKLAANRKNAQKSTGPRTEEGKRRASLNHFITGFYATLDSQRRQALETLGDEPEKLVRLQQDLMASWRPANAMQALTVADLTGLYWKKFRMENQMIADRLYENKRDEGDGKGILKQLSIWHPGCGNWNELIKLNASLDEEIAAKVKLLIQLKSFTASDSSPDDEASPDGESIDSPALDQEEPSETNALVEQGSIEEVKTEGTNPPSAILSTT